MKIPVLVNFQRAALFGAPFQPLSCRRHRCHLGQERPETAAGSFGIVKLSRINVAYAFRIWQLKKADTRRCVKHNLITS